MRISDWSSDVLLFRSLPGEALLDDAAPEDQDIDPRIFPSSGGVPRHGERRLRRRRSPGLDPRHPAGLQLGADLAGNVVVKAGPVRAGTGVRGVSGQRGSPPRAPEASPPLTNASRQKIGRAHV